MTQHNHITGTPASSADASENGSGSVPLPGLEPLALAKEGRNSTDNAELDHQSCYAPIPGTSYSQSVENAGGSSNGRSPERICYEKLLREQGPPSGRKSRKTVLVEGRDCSPHE